MLSLADSMPSFPGGNGALSIFVAKNLMVPSEARENNKKGRAFVKFIVDTNGKVVSQEIIKSSNLKWLDDEALRVVSIMPTWNPGIHEGKKVRVYFNLPISYGGDVTNKKTN